MRIEIVHADGSHSTPRIVDMADAMQTSRGHIGWDWPADLAVPEPGERVELEFDQVEMDTFFAFESGEPW